MISLYNAKKNLLSYKTYCKKKQNRNFTLYLALQIFGSQISKRNLLNFGKRPSISYCSLIRKNSG